MWEAASASLLGEEPTELGLRQAWLRRAVLPEHRGLEVSVSRLSSQCQCSAASGRWLDVYAEGVGEGNGTSQLLCSWRGVSMNASSQGCPPISSLCAPGILQIAASMLSAPWVVCLSSLLEQGSGLQALSQPRLLTFKTPGFKPCCL